MNFDLEKDMPKGKVKRHGKEDEMVLYHGSRQNDGPVGLEA